MVSNSMCRAKNNLYPRPICAKGSNRILGFVVEKGLEKDHRGLA